VEGGEEIEEGDRAVRMYFVKREKKAETKDEAEVRESEVERGDEKKRCVASGEALAR
jgi:hypothetical protein